MTSIDVPDWVVDAAVEAFLSNTGQEHKVTDLQRNLTRECMAPALIAALGAWVVREPYRLGNRYMTQGGEEVTLNQVANYGTSYESMCDDAGVHRYTRRDFGRVTGSSHDYSDQRNIPPIYTLRQEKPE